MLWLLATLVYFLFGLSMACWLAYGYDAPNGALYFTTCAWPLFIVMLVGIFLLAPIFDKLKKAGRKNRYMKNIASDIIL